MQPKCVCFSPTNWRYVTVAYEQEVNIWNLELFDDKRVKTTHKRFLLPPSDDNTPDLMVDPDFKSEFQYPYSAIASLEETYAEVIDEVLDKRKRHAYRSLVWSNTDDILVSTNENYIFKVRRNTSIAVNNSKREIIT